MGSKVGAASVLSGIIVLAGESLLEDLELLLRVLDLVGVAGSREDCLDDLLGVLVWRLVDA